MPTTEVATPVAPAPPSPAPAQAPTPTPAAPKPPERADTHPQAEIAKLADGLDDIAEWQDATPKADKPAAPAPAKTEPAKPAKAEAKPEAPKPAEENLPELSDDIAELVKPGTKTKTTPPPPQVPKELREAYEGSQKRIKELEAERATAVAKVQQDYEKTKAELEKVQTELKYYRYEATDEFQEKYVKPLAAIQKRAESVIRGAKIDLGDGNVREATLDDVVNLARMEPGVAWDHTDRLFGTRAPLIHQTIQSIRDGWESMQNARNEWRTKGADFEKDNQARQEQLMQSVREAEDSRMTELAEKLPDIFGEPKDDQEAVDAMRKSQAFVDVAMGRAKFREGIPQEEQAKAIARARGELAARSRAFPRLLLNINRQADQIAELQKELEAFKNSEPKTTQASDVRDTPKSDNIVDGLDALVEER